MAKVKLSAILLIAVIYYGVIPVALVPNVWHLDPFNFTGYSFPYPMTPYTARHTVWLFGLPLIFMAYAIIRGRYAYHGLWMAFLAIGMLWKFQSMGLALLVPIAVIAVCGIINFIAFQKMTGAEFSTILKIRFGDVRAEKQKQLQSGGDAQHDSSRSEAIRYVAQRPTRNFSTLAGMAELKERLLKAGNDVVTKKGARNGILLTGEPGNGKTVMAEALAGELKLPMISVSFGDFVSKWVGETTERVMKVFDDAELQAPCVLFIDEVEALLVDRGSITNADSEAPKTVSSVLKRIVDLRSKGVVLIAATNYVERMDKAAIREGRFDFKIEVLPPDREARIFLLGNGMKAIKNSVDADAVERAANRWEGYSVSRILAIANEAVDRMQSGKIDHVGFDELMNCLRATQSSKGTRIPESALSLEQLVLEPEMRNRLNNLAHRMIKIERIEQMGGSVPGGVLFYGPPGTGKTVGAMALAKSTNWSFLATTGPDLMESEDEIDKLVASAKDLRPCIVFIDEADDVLADRRMSPLSKRITNKLIASMDGTGGKVRDVLYIAATNAPDMIDEAALRGGRFTEKVGFTLPDADAVRDYIYQWMSATKAKLSSSFTLDAATQFLNGQSLANIKECLQGAVNVAVVREDGTVTLDDLAVSMRNLEIA